jgi:ABC-type uncharacterized transport system substrate-binding protein
MLSRFAIVVFAAMGLVGLSRPAQAHPHVWVTVKAELVHDGDNRVAAVRHHWTFDEAYSAYALQGLDTNNDGAFSLEELADLAKVNTESLAEFDFFTVVKTDGKRQEFATPREGWLEHDNGKLTLHFTLPLKDPALARRTLILDVADPTFFVDFSYAQGDGAVSLVGGPKGCDLKITRPKKPDMAQSRLSEDYFANANMGLQFASKVVVACP